MITHKAICEFLGISETRTPHYSCPLWTVSKTRIEIYVEGDYHRAFGGALVCGNCGYGVDLIPRDALVCPKCGCREIEKKKEQK